MFDSQNETQQRKQWTAKGFELNERRRQTNGHDYPPWRSFFLLTIPLLSELCFSPRELREVLQCLGGEAWKRGGRGRTLVAVAGGDLQLHHEVNGVLALVGLK